MLFLVVPLALIVAAHCCFDADSEPFFNNDETRHVTTGVFFRDALADGGWKHLKTYAVRYYLQYPALGLMVWPPFFYGVEGASMSLFGTSFLAARWLIALFGIVAGIYFFRLVLRSHDRPTAALALLIFGCSPLVFSLSRQVMLEIPALAFALAAIFHFERRLAEERRWDAWLACLFAALTALTRFDGIFLLPYFMLRLAMLRRFGILRRGSVLGGIVTALFLTGPYYFWTWSEYGSTIAKAVSDGTSATSTSFFAVRNLIYYPTCIPEQIGWFATIAAALGLLSACRKESRQAMGPYFALMAATYLTFTPMAELEPRHSIYWVPALAVFCVEGCALLARVRKPADVLSPSPLREGVGRRLQDNRFVNLLRRQKLSLFLKLLVVAGTLWSALREPAYYVFGYEEAAVYVVEHNRETPVCLIDGFLNGGFIYQIRRHDPERRLWVLRGDKIFYSMLSDPHAGYADRVRDESEMLDLIHRYDPELLVVEEPQLYFELPGATLLRKTLHDHPEQFRLEKTVPIRSNHFRFAGARLEIWRNLVRNPQRTENWQVEMMSLGKEFKK